MPRSDGESDEPVGEQLALLRPAGRARTRKRADEVAQHLPVARVLVDSGLPQLDRVFDYHVPASLAEAALPGVRCTVRLAGQRLSGFITARVESSDFSGLQQLQAVSGVPVLTPEALALAENLAADNAGTVSDVLRLAVPPRHAGTEKAVYGHEVKEPEVPSPPPPRAWSRYRGGGALLTRVQDAQAPRAVWTALPASSAFERWPAALAEAAHACVAGGRGCVIVVPDHRDAERVASALGDLGLRDLVARLSADTGAAARYRAFLRVLRGEAPIVVGTRAAAFAPIRNPGLFVCWDDGDDSHVERRTPYLHARDVLIARAEQHDAAMLIGGQTRTTDAQLLLDAGWAKPVEAVRELVRAVTPRVIVSGDDEWRDAAARTARLPSQALRIAREALQRGPVLVQVPQAGYVPGIACQRCRASARCRHCEGPLRLISRDAPPHCAWCDRGVSGWTCRTCGDARLRAIRIGSMRTAEEIARALPGVPLRNSTADAGVIEDVGAESQLIVATPGAEPVATQGYSAALLLDGWVSLARPELTAAEDAVRRWFGAASLVRPASEGGQVLIVAEANLAPVQALVRWSPGVFAERELAERRALRLPPAAVLAEARVTGKADDLATARGAIAEYLKTVKPPAGVEVLGPAEDDTDAWVLFRAPLEQRGSLAQALGAARAVQAARHKAVPPRVRMRVASVS